MLGKLLFVFTIFNLCFGTNFEMPRNDMIITPTGEKIEGHIQTVIDGVITIDTDKGQKTFVREGDIYSSRDIVETGIVRTIRQAGYIKYMGTDRLEMTTTSGDYTVKRALVRKIIISHESTLPPLDL